MLTATLALALLGLFVPEIVRRTALRHHRAEVAATAAQLDSAVTAATNFARGDNVLQSATVYTDARLTRELSAYGLPIGFLPKTPFGQNIKMFAKNETVLLIVSAGKTSKLDRAEIANRVGLFAGAADDDEIRGRGWRLSARELGLRPESDATYVLIPRGDEFSELVSKKSGGKFFANLSMGGFAIIDAGAVSAARIHADTLDANELIIGAAKIGADIKRVEALRAIFQSEGAENSLSITRAPLSADAVTTDTVSKFGTLGSVTAGSVDVRDFGISAGGSSFYGPKSWNIAGNAKLNNISITADSIEVAGILDVTQSVDLLALNWVQNGIFADNLTAGSITLRDQLGGVLAGGGMGKVILDIRVGGTSQLPDALVTSIDNNAIKILRTPLSDNADTESCRAIINSIGGAYDAKSLSQNIVCQYVQLNRLEQRINAKKCLQEGKTCGA